MRLREPYHNVVGVGGSNPSVPTGFILSIEREKLMPYIAGRRLSTPLIRSFESWSASYGGKKPTTIREYRLVVEQLAAEVAGTGHPMVAVPPAPSCPNADFWSSDVEIEWSDVSLAQIESYMSTLVCGGVRAPSVTVMRKRKFALQAFFKYLDRLDFIGRDPTRHIVIPSQHAGKPKPLADEQFLAVWNTPLMGLDDRVWLGLGYFCGFRRHEMILVASSMFDLSSRRIVGFHRKGGKSGDLPYGKVIDAFERTTRLDPGVGRAAVEWERCLGQYIAARGSEYRLLPFREDYASEVDAPNAINRRMKRYSRTITPHQLRHSFATNLFRMKVDMQLVKDAMSHSNINTTNGYTDTESGWDDVA